MRILVLPLAVALLLLRPTAGAASMITYSDRLAFYGEGAIAFESDFTDFGAGLTTLSPCDFARGDVTYQGTSCLFIWGSDTIWTKTEPLIGDIDYPMAGFSAYPSLEAKYNMFGFDAGVYGGNQGGPVNLLVTTNVGTYAYPGLRFGDSASGQLAFIGFIASPGEYFTQIRIQSQYEDGVLAYGPKAGITNVAVGHVVPEPTALGLFAVASACFAMRRRRDHNVVRAGRSGAFGRPATKARWRTGFRRITSAV